MTEPFELQPEPVLVRSGEFARRLAGITGGPPVSTQTIANWAKKGLVTVAKTDADGDRLFDLAVALPQALANRPGGRHGGPRANAGRKRKAPPVELPIQAAADAAHARDSVRLRTDTDPTIRPLQAVPVAELLNLSQNELRCLLGHNPAHQLGIDTNSLQRLKAVLDLQAEQRKELERAGKLVEADEVLARWTEKNAAIVKILDALPGRVADTVASSAWIGQDAVDRLISLMKDGGTPGPCLDLLRQHLARPADLVPRLRAILAEEVRGCRERVVEAEG